MIPSITIFPMKRLRPCLNHKLLNSVRYQILAILIILLLPSPAASVTPAPPPPPPVSDYQIYNSNLQPKFGLVVLIITVFIFLLAFLSLCIRHCRNDRSSVSTVITGRSRRGHRGLDPAVLQSFPTFNYSAVKEMKMGKGALECAVCINEFEDDETLRFIPKCDHVFHVECIDMWLDSHATCPVCRANLVPVPGESFDVPVLGPCQPNNQNDDVVVDVATPAAATNEGESMEQPLHARARGSLIRSLTRGLSGRRRWFGLFLRSHSTGHVEINHSVNSERFTLRLPADVRRQIIGGKLSRTTSCLAPSTAGGSQVGNRVAYGGSYREGSSQGRLSGRFSRADRWVFSVTRPFFTTETKMEPAGSVQTSTVAQPALPPV